MLFGGGDSKTAADLEKEYRRDFFITSTQVIQAESSDSFISQHHSLNSRSFAALKILIVQFDDRQKQS